MNIYERLWDLWSLHDFNWEIDYVYERYEMWKAISHIMMMDPLWSMMLKRYSILCCQKLKKKLMFMSQDID